MSSTTPTHTIKGHVKWFDPTKGFGFIVPEDGGKDVLLHANVLRNFGQGSVADGAEIEIEVQETDRGLQAVSVVDIAVVVDSIPPLRDMEELSPEDIAKVTIEPARVKWFDKAKGFGFANVFRDPEDVFVHIDVLRRSGLANLQAGEAIGVRLFNGERGRMAIDVVTWDNVS
ncbi:MAG: cold shock domain-containing protein [Yoonia sp.]|uniref:cold-shock protein n=1 Tax=Rhodobacterales TaxID=204455 RepID=UPI001FF2FA14|nr:cold shock domain-containing protein [Loktanella sp. F6476L]MCK0119734.1 cold shock domain-containing protein [Loktanella sp. F6476L]UWQ97792.1 cold shock domain-containing protein [Rhodobacteraceae bacterium S2214]